MKIAILGITTADVVVSNLNDLPQVGQLVLSNNISLYTGGCACNVAIDLSKIGLNSNYYGAIGDDFLGVYMKGELNKDKINIDNLKVLKDTSTSSSIVIINSNGERSFIHNQGANGAYDLIHINIKQLAQNDLLYVGGVFLMNKLDGQNLAHLLKEIKNINNEITIIVDTAFDCTNQWSSLISPSYQYIDYFIPSYEEASKISSLL
ncbi:MAG: carbohydrate kinase family protein, partial [Bacilli bacterium]